MAVTGNLPAPLVDPGLVDDLQTAEMGSRPVTRDLQTVHENARTAGARLHGRIITVPREHQEAPDFDFCRFTTRALWFVMLILSPLFLLNGVYETYNGWTAVLTVVAGLLVIRYLVPGNLLSWLGFSILMGNRRPPAGVPARTFRLRELDSGRETLVRMKGDLRHGDLGADDIVSLWGCNRRGTFRAHRGFNHRIHARIEPRRSRYGIFLLITLAGVFFMVYSLADPAQSLYDFIEPFQERGRQWLDSQ